MNSMVLRRSWINSARNSMLMARNSKNRFSEEKRISLGPRLCLPILRKRRMRAKYLEDSWNGFWVKSILDSLSTKVKWKMLSLTLSTKIRSFCLYWNDFVHIFLKKFIVPKVFLKAAFGPSNPIEIWCQIILSKKMTEKIK